MAEAQREAYDLFHPACRRNFKRLLKWNRWDIGWWLLVCSDTFHRVCSRKGGTR